jgi:predicted small metal-binding protein
MPQFRDPSQNHPMSRKYIDCREFPGEIKCSIAMAADSDDELMEAAVQHAVAVHGFQDTPELRQELKSCFRNGTPPVKTPKPVSA